MLFKLLLILVPLVAVANGVHSNVIDIPAKNDIEYYYNDTTADPGSFDIDPFTTNEPLATLDSVDSRETEDSEADDTQHLSPLKRNESFAADTLATTYGDIVLSSVIFHHGEYQPGHTYPKDPYKHLFGKTDPILTNEGKEQIYNLGKWIRTRYKNLIGPTYDNRGIQIDSQSDILPFTSAETLLAGLFPPAENEVWNPSLLWQPIPIRFPKEINDDCPYYDALFDELMESDECVNFYRQHEAFFNNISEATGLSFSMNLLLRDFQKLMYQVLDVLQYEEKKGLILPKWTSSFYPQPLTNVATLFIVYTSSYLEMLRLKVGPVIKKIINDVIRAVNEKSSIKLHMYSVTGDKIGSILIGLGLYNKIRPPFGSALLIELRQKSEEYVITISYKNSNTSAPVLLNIKGCGPVCSLNKFINITEPFASGDWEKECSVIEMEEYGYLNDEPNGSTFVCIAAAIAFVFLAFAIIVGAYKVCIKGRPKYSVFDLKMK